MDILAWVLMLIMAFGPAFALGMIPGALISRNVGKKGRGDVLGTLCAIVTGLLSVVWGLGFFDIPDPDSIVDSYAKVGVIAVIVATVIAGVVSWFLGVMFGGYVYDEVDGYLYRRMRRHKHQ